MSASGEDFSVKRWRVILSRACFVFSAVLVLMGIAFTVSLVSHYGQATSAVDLALQASLIWAPPALLCALAGVLLRRADKKHSDTEK